MEFEDFVNNEEFNHKFQPIYNIKDWVIVGHEVFIRSEVFSNPEEIFNLARKRERLYDLESGSIHKAIETYKKAGSLNKHGRLFINVFPSTILNGNFQPFLNGIMANLQVPCQHIFLEILESENIDDYTKLKESIRKLKNKGFLIAVDDFGKGNCDIKRVVELDPDIIKLDRYFTIGLTKSKEKQFVLKLIVDYCLAFDKQLILEGLGKPEDLAFTKVSGILYGQGYALGRPKNLDDDTIFH